MNLTDKDIEEINNYFNQDLTDLDKIVFETRLKTDADFRQTAMEYQATAAVLNTVKMNKQKAFLNKLDAAMPPYKSETPVRSLNRNWWAMAAAGLVLVAAGFWWFGQRKTREIDDNSLVMAYFEPYPSLNSTRGNEQKDTKSEAFDAYDAEKYHEATKLFDAAFVEKSDSILLFYKAIAELGGGESVKAEQHFDSLKGTNNLPQQALTFYIGLSAAENKNREKAIFELKKVANTEGVYQSKAKEILMILGSKK